MKAVAYLRVSTEAQGAEGLGIEAQRHRVTEMAKDCDLVATFVEVESGGRSDRPELAKAIATAKKHKAVLMVAKLDRLARDTRFLLKLADSKLGIAFGDMPGMDCKSSIGKLQLTMMAAFAEFERNRIQERIKEALAQMKARIQKDGHAVTKGGRKIVRLGNPRIETLAATRKARATHQAKDLRSTVEDLKAEGITTVRGIVEALNAKKIPTPRGGRWHVPTVHRLLQRLEA